MNKKYDKFFLAHLSQLVQDKYDLSDEQLERLLSFMTQMGSPQAALKKILREQNRKAVDALVENLFAEQKTTEMSPMPVTPPNMLTFPLNVPLTDTMIIGRH